jgi:hypothetical protein
MVRTLPHKMGELAVTSHEYSLFCTRAYATLFEMYLTLRNRLIILLPSHDSILMTTITDMYFNSPPLDQPPL